MLARGQGHKRFVSRLLWCLVSVVFFFWGGGLVCFVSFGSLVFLVCLFGLSFFVFIGLILVSFCVAWVFFGNAYGQGGSKRKVLRVF